MQAIPYRERGTSCLHLSIHWAMVSSYMPLRLLVQDELRDLADRNRLTLVSEREAT